MTLEMVTLFGFQVTLGYVYAEVSLIVTAFMAGLALGGAISNRLLAHWSSVEGEGPSERSRRAKQTLILLQASVAVCSSVLLLILLAPFHPTAVVFLLFALLAGCLTGMAFPLAVAAHPASAGGEASHGVGMLYGADLVGGCLGVATTAVFLVPVLGIPQTCAVIALVGLVGLLALV
jgi:spermidine synthase